MSELQEAQFKRVIDRLLDDNKALRDLVDWQAAENKRLREALGNVSRMKVFPDPQINQFTLATAIQIASAALGEGKE